MFRTYRTFIEYKTFEPFKPITHAELYVDSYIINKRLCRTILSLDICYSGNNWIVYYLCPQQLPSHFTVFLLH